MLRLDEIREGKIKSEEKMEEKFVSIKLDRLLLGEFRTCVGWTKMGAGKKSGQKNRENAGKGEKSSLGVFGVRSLDENGSF